MVIADSFLFLLSNNNTSAHKLGMVSDLFLSLTFKCSPTLYLTLSCTFSHILTLSCTLSRILLHSLALSHTVSYTLSHSLAHSHIFLQSLTLSCTLLHSHSLELSHRPCEFLNVGLVIITFMTIQIKQLISKSVC